MLDTKTEGNSAANRKKYIRAIKNRKIEYGNEISYTAIPYPIQKVADSTREDKQKGRIKTPVLHCIPIINARIPTDMRISIGNGKEIPQAPSVLHTAKWGQ